MAVIGSFHQVVGGISWQEGALWLLGRGEHCAVEYWPVMIPQMADWLKEKINK
jgi:hypothetical protein